MVFIGELWQGKSYALGGDNLRPHQGQKTIGGSSHPTFHDPPHSRINAPYPSLSEHACFALRNVSHSHNFCFSSQLPHKERYWLPCQPRRPLRYLIRSTALMSDGCCLFFIIRSVHSKAHLRSRRCAHLAGGCLVR